MVGCGGGGKTVVDVVLMVVLWAERNLGVVGEGELTRRMNDRIIFEERPLVDIAINGTTETVAFVVVKS